MSGQRREAEAPQMLAIDLRPVLYVLGSLLVVIAIAMLVPMLMDLGVGNPDWLAFGISSSLTLFCGVMLVLMNQAAEVRLSLRQTFVVTSLSYVVVCGFCAVPFMFTNPAVALNVTDAYFEAMSGLTTTGSTVITDLDAAPSGLLLWRAMIQWLGGIGIIGVGIAILPFLSVGGMQLFRSESSDRSDKVVPRAGELAQAIFTVYLFLTLSCAALLHWAGMELFDAACHAMTTVSTGGYSTADTSLANWDSPTIHWIVTLFMVTGALPFVAMLAMRADPLALVREPQVRGLLIMFLLVITGVTIKLALQGIEIEDALRLAAFNVVSIVTTTGFAIGDYQLWGEWAVALVFLLTLFGGCTGSTSGGIKMFRFQILFLVLATQLARSFSPNRVMALRYADKPVGQDIMLSVTSFIFVYLALMLLTGVVLGMTGLDFTSALSAAATAIGNVGPGLGAQIGPAGTFADVPDAAKWVLSAAMMMGRLEFFTVLVILNPEFWRR